MKNKTTIHLCIADINDLLTKALREHFLKSDEYEVEEVVWVDRENHFRITMGPKNAEKAVS